MPDEPLSGPATSQDAEEDPQAIIARLEAEAAGGALSNAPSNEPVGEPSNEPSNEPAAFTYDEGDGTLYRGDEPYTDDEGNRYTVRGGVLYDHQGNRVDPASLGAPPVSAPPEPEKPKAEPTKPPAPVVADWEQEWQEIEAAMREDLIADLIADGYDPESDGPETAKAHKAAIERKVANERRKFGAMIRYSRAGSATVEGLAAVGVDTAKLEESERARIEKAMAGVAPHLQGTKQGTMLAVFKDALEAVEKGAEPGEQVSRLAHMFGVVKPAATPPVALPGGTTAAARVTTTARSYTPPYSSAAQMLADAFNVDPAAAEDALKPSTPRRRNW